MTYKGQMSRVQSSTHVCSERRVLTCADYAPPTTIAKNLRCEQSSGSQGVRKRPRLAGDAHLPVPGTLCALF